MKFPSQINLPLILTLFLGIIIQSCNTDYMPKPRGYFRIDLPEKNYIVLDSTYPFTFDYPVYARIIQDTLSPDQPYWFNLDFPEFKGRLHMSYKNIDGNLAELVEDSRTMAYKHINKASAIDNRLIFNRQDSVYGLIFEIEGLGVASPYQFFVTDSVQHFLRGAMYFNIEPNNDSLAPVIEFLKKDFDRMISSLKWNPEPRKQ